MRVTQQTLQSSWNRDVQSRLESIDQLNRQIGSGLRVEKPSDDPTAASRIVRIEEVVARNEQYLKNVAEATAMNAATESVLAQVQQHLATAKSIAVEGANDASVAVSGGFQALADEIAGLRSGILQMAMSTHEGRYLFAGTSDELAPFGAGGGAYQGDSNQRRVNLGNGQSVSINLSGDRAFRETEALGAPLVLNADGDVFLSSDLVFRVGDGTNFADISLAAGTYAPSTLVDEMNGYFNGAGLSLQARLTADGALSVVFSDTAAGGEISIEQVTGELQDTLGLSPGTKNVFGLLSDLEAALQSQDSERVSRLLGRLDRALDGLGAQRGVVGSQGRNLEFARDRIQTYNVTSESLKADIEGADTVETITKLSAQEQAYQTALAAGARIFSVSILDFLR